MIMLCSVGCDSNVDTNTSTDQDVTTDTNTSPDSSEGVSDYCVEIGVSYDEDNFVTIKIELLPAYAPITVSNFLELVQSGYYDGTIMHRIIEDFCVQGGGYVYDEYGSWQSAGTVDAIYGEFTSNGSKNTLSHTAGAISMARTSVANSATSQFFLCPTDVTYLDGNYAVFGYVMDEESLVAIQTLSRVPTNTSTGEPISPVTIDYIKMI